MDDKQTDELLASILTRPTKELASKIADLDSKIANVKTQVPEKGDKGEIGATGRDGRNGSDGRDGRDGLNGRNGKDGKDGVDGEDGQQGVSITDVEIAMDNHLVITLSDGSEIDAGALSSGDGKDNFFISTSPQAVGGGGGGEQTLFVQSTAPVTAEPTYMWIQTNIGSDPNSFSFWFEDGL